MSEYQYYEFRAIDRPLNPKEMAELRSYSTGARITTTSFVNDYSWGSFKGDEDACLLVLGDEREDQLPVLLAHPGAFAGAVLAGRLGVEKARRQAQLQHVGSPVREVEERVEVLLHPATASKAMVSSPR